MNYLSDELLLDLDAFIQKFYQDPRVEERILFQTTSCSIDLDAYLKQKSKSFQDKLFEIMREKILMKLKYIKEEISAVSCFLKLKVKKIIILQRTQFFPWQLEWN